MSGLEMAGRYAVLLVRRDIDRFNHHDLFAFELAAAFAERGVEIRTIDYLKKRGEVEDAIFDPKCAFAISFNGFGSEIQRLTGARVSLFTAADRPLFDLMHDCPIHDTMAHQVAATFKHRQLLSTDYTYAYFGRFLGVRDVKVVPSITFPAAFPGPIRKHKDRQVDVLLPISLPHPDLAKRALHGASPDAIKVFQRTVDRCLGDARLHPISAIAAAANEIGIAMDWRRSASRTLLTCAIDFVKFESRRRLVRAIAGLPVTIVTDRPFDEKIEGAKIEFRESRSVRELFSTMSMARTVVCPAPHLSGAHERPLGAFTVGSAVLSSPNEILETQFVPGTDFLCFNGEKDLPSAIESALQDPQGIEETAARGHAKAMIVCSPRKLIDTILGTMAMFRAEVIGSAQDTPKAAKYAQPA